MPDGHMAYDHRAEIRGKAFWRWIWIVEVSSREDTPVRKPVQAPDRAQDACGEESAQRASMACSTLKVPCATRFALSFLAVACSAPLTCAPRPLRARAAPSRWRTQRRFERARDERRRRGRAAAVERHATRAPPHLSSFDARHARARRSTRGQSSDVDATRRSTPRTRGAVVGRGELRAAATTSSRHAIAAYLPRMPPAARVSRPVAAGPPGRRTCMKPPRWTPDPPHRVGLASASRELRPHLTSRSMPWTPFSEAQG